LPIPLKNIRARIANVASGALTIDAASVWGRKKLSIAEQIALYESLNPVESGEIKP
jgi:hypothetical protein